MAQRVNIQLVCDFCAAEDAARADPVVPGGAYERVATETFEIAITGPVYTVDLCDDHAKAVQDLRALVQNVGRTERRGVRREKPRPYNVQTKDPKRARTYQLQRVRAWAREHGYEVSNARVPYGVQRAYNDAHPDDQVALADGGRGTAAGQSAAASW